MRLRRRTIALLIGDPIIGLISFVLGYALCHHGAAPNFGQPRTGILLISFVAVSETVFIGFGMYSRLWRYAGIRDLCKVVTGVTTSQVLWALVLMTMSFTVSWYVQFAIWLIYLCGVAGLRLLFRIRDDILAVSVGSKSKRRRVLIVGAGQAGAMVLRDIQRDRNHRYEPVCFVDDDRTKHGMNIYGVPVRGRLDQIPRLVQNLGIEEVLMAIPTAPKSLLNRLLEYCRELNVPLKIVPGINELIDGRVSANQIREVRVEDLLGREPIQLDLGEIAGYLQGKRVLVTGAGGSIGSEICRQVSRFRPELIMLMGRGENSIFEIEQEMRAERPGTHIYPVIGDVRDQVLVDKLFADLRPHVVFHAAAHKHVPLMEAWPGEAVKNNVFGTYNVIDACDRYDVERFVLVSTDKAVNPTSIMGASKRVAELIMQAYARLKKGPVYTAVRFGNVLGSRGSVVPLFRRQIARGGPITITHPDMTRYFMTIPEAVQLVIQAGSMARGGEIFILDMGDPVKIVDLAENMIRLSGFEPGRDIEIQFTGIRPGEKLFEEILTAEEGTQATKHKRIYVANLPVELNKRLTATREKFWEYIDQEDEAGILGFIEDLILSDEARQKRRNAAAEDEAAAAGDR